MSARVIAIANRKGGVGKTTSAISISAELAARNLRTLLVDLDPQGNATTGLGIDPRSVGASTYHALTRAVPITDCVLATSVPGLEIVPAISDLADAEVELASALSREHRLRGALDAVKPDYDYVIVDCPPSLGLLTINGLAAATELVIPVQCEYYALEGLAQMLGNIDLIQTDLNPNLTVTAIMLVMFDSRTNLAGDVVDDVRRHFGELVCRHVVPRSVKLAEAPSHGQPIGIFDPESAGAAAYAALTVELIERDPHAQASSEHQEPAS